MYINGGDHWDFYFPLFYLALSVAMAGVSCLIVQMGNMGEDTEDHLQVENTARMMYIIYFGLNMAMTVIVFFILMPIK
jgi:hypothetical protein